MNQTVQLLMRDAGLTETLSAEDRNAKLEQFMNDTYAMERQVAFVSKLSRTAQMLGNSLWYFSTKLEKKFRQNFELNGWQTHLLWNSILHYKLVSVR